MQRHIWDSGTAYSPYWHNWPNMVLQGSVMMKMGSCVHCFYKQWTSLFKIMTWNVSLICLCSLFKSKILFLFIENAVAHKKKQMPLDSILGCCYSNPGILSGGGCSFDSDVWQRTCADISEKIQQRWRSDCGPSTTTPNWGKDMFNTNSACLDEESFNMLFMPAACRFTPWFKRLGQNAMRQQKQNDSVLD